MKSGGKTLDVMRGTRQRGSVTLSKERMDQLRMDIRTRKLLAKVKCKSPTPLGTLDSMSLKCKAAFIKQLYRGPVSGKTIFRGSAPRLLRMSYGRVQSYLASVKAVLANAAGAPAAAPAVPQPPVIPVTPPSTATKPENDAALKKVMRMAANEVYQAHCLNAAESSAVGGKKTCKDVPDAPVDVYKMLKQVSLDDMPAALKAKVIAKFKAMVAKDDALKAKYSNVDGALVKKMWAANAFGTERPEDAKPPKRDATNCGEGTVMKDGQCVVKKEEGAKKSGSKSSSIFRMYLTVGVAGASTNMRTTKPASDSDDTLNKAMPFALGADLFVGAAVSPLVEIGGRLSLFYTVSDKRQIELTTIDPTHNVTASLRVESNIRVYKKDGHVVKIGASVGAGIMHGTKLLLGTLGDGLNVTVPVFSGGAHVIYKNGLFFAKLGLDGDAILTAFTTRDSAYFPTSTEMKGQIKGGAFRFSLGLGIGF